LVAEARRLYGAVENELDIAIWHELPLLRSLHGPGNVNDWSLRENDPDYADYVDPAPDPGRLAELMHPVHGLAGIRQTARVDLPLLVASWRKRLLETSRMEEIEVDYPALVPHEIKWQYAGSLYDRVICCEGWRARYNPYFSYLPHYGNKGEVLYIRTPQLPPIDRMVKNRVFLVPQSDGSYWVGATNGNRFENDERTERGRQWLIDQLDTVLRTPYEIIRHDAAVRPTVKDRRPLIGEHPGYPGLYIFNGLGSKGGSLGPLGSRWLFDFLEGGASLPEEVDILRYTRPADDQ
jgi:glycine/D-amino acid oxidase-like deaminating enzyme